MSVIKTLFLNDLHLTKGTRAHWDKNGLHCPAERLDEGYLMYPYDEWEHRDSLPKEVVKACELAFINDCKLILYHPTAPVLKKLRRYKP